MKKTILAAVAAISFSVSMAQTQPPSIIPIPAALVSQPGKFVLTNNLSISGASDPELLKIAGHLSNSLRPSTGFNIQVVQEQKAGGIQLVLLKNFKATLGNEGYQLQVTNQQVTISANKSAGLFYGVQTLLQLLAKEIESKQIQKGIAWTIPCVSIDDQPRFGWRGLMLDVSRHFFTKAEVKKFMDDMVRFKFNLLHLHLTDDEGWRIEIKSLPKLTSVGAWRVERNGKWSNSPKAADDNEPKTYGGFYTQEDIRELVQYAKERYVTILPEIDVPGHSLAAVAAYPQLSATPGEHKVYQGIPFMNWFTGGFAAIVDNSISPANEFSYEFIDKVMTEVAQLFPFEYIHMGGDECAKNFWEKSPEIKALMAREGLKTMNEVEGYFVKRVEKIIQSKGKKMIGWDEILEGGVSPTANVMSWRGVKGGIEAAKSKHNVVMSPTTFTYVDYVQGEPTLEGPVYASLRLNKTYQFDPVQEGMDPKYVLGGQANMWSEQIANYRYQQYMMWPRGLAIAESVWSPKEKKDWNGFFKRVENQFDRWDLSGDRYAKSVYDAIVTATKDEKGNLVLQIDSEIEGVAHYYSIDESAPDNHYPKYGKPVTLTDDVQTVRIISYRNGKQVGRQINLPVTELRKRAEKK